MKHYERDEISSTARASGPFRPGFQETLGIQSLVACLLETSPEFGECRCGNLMDSLLAHPEGIALHDTR
jgi:hypothetical protein